MQIAFIGLRPGEIRQRIFIQAMGNDVASFKRRPIEGMSHLAFELNHVHHGIEFFVSIRAHPKGQVPSQGAVQLESGLSHAELQACARAGLVEVFRQDGFEPFLLRPLYERAGRAIHKVEDIPALPVIPPARRLDFNAEARDFAHERIGQSLRPAMREKERIAVVKNDLHSMAGDLFG